jgi:hypothetical protein
MAIDVTCAGCHTRFQVSEKFAGKKGPCPKCKATIQVPALTEQVVIHEPESFGPKDASGRAVLKPIFREEVRLTTPVIVGIVMSIVVVLFAGLVLRVSFPGGTVPRLVTILGSILLAPPLAFAGYTFLRDDELAPHRGLDLALRLIACSVVYPLLWGLYWFVFAYLGVYPSWQILCFVVPAMVAVGAFTAQTSLDLELGAGALHYTLYLVATVLMRVIMGMDPHWHIAG